MTKCYYQVSWVNNNYVLHASYTVHGDFAILYDNLGMTPLKVFFIVVGVQGGLHDYIYI